MRKCCSRSRSGSRWPRRRFVMSSPLTKVRALERQAKRHASHYRELFITYEGRSEEIPLNAPLISACKVCLFKPHAASPRGAVLKIREGTNESEPRTRCQCQPRIGSSALRLE